MELTLIAMLEAMGGWDIVYRMGAAVMMTSLIIEAIKARGCEDINNFLKLASAFIASIIISLMWGGSLGIFGRNVAVTFFTSTFLWRELLKPILKKMRAKWMA